MNKKAGYSVRILACKNPNISSEKGHIRHKAKSKVQMIIINVKVQEDMCHWCISKIGY